MTLDWYFDFISPYAYLQWQRLGELPAGVEVRYRPILFAALLDHWGQLGPAEIPPKRLFTYRHVDWLARQSNVPLNMPRAHPFNPLPLLRLAWALDCRRAAIDRIFRHVWVERGHCTDLCELEKLGTELGLENVTASITQFKEELRQAGNQAIAAGVFGVPSFVRGDVVLWGQDAIEMIADWQETPGLFSADTARLSTVPTGASRR